MAANQKLLDREDGRTINAKPLTKWLLERIFDVRGELRASENDVRTAHLAGLLSAYQEILLFAGNNSWDSTTGE